MARRRKKRGVHSPSASDLAEIRAGKGSARDKAEAARGGVPKKFKKRKIKKRRGR